MLSISFYDNMVLGGWIIIIELHYMVFGGFGGWCCFDQQMCVVGLNCINVFFDMWINRWSNGLWFTYTGTGATTKSLKALLNVEPCLDPLTWTNDHGWIDVQQRFGGGLLRCSTETSAALRILFWATSGTKPAPPLWGCRQARATPQKRTRSATGPLRIGGCLWKLKRLDKKSPGNLPQPAGGFWGDTVVALASILETIRSISFCTTPVAAGQEETWSKAWC